MNNTEITAYARVMTLKSVYPAFIIRSCAITAPTTINGNAIAMPSTIKSSPTIIPQMMIAPGFCTFVASMTKNTAPSNDATAG